VNTAYSSWLADRAIARGSNSANTCHVLPKQPIPANRGQPARQQEAWPPPPPANTRSSSASAWPAAVERCGSGATTPAPWSASDSLSSSPWRSSPGRGQPGAAPAPALDAAARLRGRGLPALRRRRQALPPLGLHPGPGPPAGAPRERGGHDHGMEQKAPTALKAANHT
jgi:hypothetical protein